MTGNSLITGTEARAVAQLPAPVAVQATAAPAQAAPNQPALTLRLVCGLVGMLLASLLAILNEQVTALSLADIQGALSIGHDDGTWLTTLFEAGNVAAMVFAPWFRHHVHAQAIHDRHRARDDVLRSALPVRNESADALCTACHAGNCWRLPSADADHRRATLSSAQSEAIRPRRLMR